jgi:hypothetical protein
VARIHSSIKIDADSAAVRPGSPAISGLTTTLR